MGNSYDVRAIKAFADALSAVTRHQVEVRVGGGKARTNGKSVWLPDTGVWEEGDFQALCGVACHEISHVWFGTHRVHRRFVRSHPKSDRNMAALCFNAVADITDETRFEKAFRRAEELFRKADEACLEKALNSKDIPTRPPVQASSPEQLLAAAIWLTRSKPHSEIRRKLRGWRTRVPGLEEACRILRRAARSGVRRPFTPNRTPNEWNHLRALATELISLLKKHFPELSQNTRPLRQARDSVQQWRQVALADAAEEARIRELAGRAATCEHWESASKDRPHTRELLSLWFAALEEPVGYDESCYHSVFPTFRRIATQLATGPGLDLEDGYRSGSSMGRPHRAFTDGKCFRRRLVTEATNAAIAFVFDHSGSMLSHIEVFLPVGAALADALKYLPDTDLAIWRFGTRVEQVDSTDLKKPRLMGGTRTDLALDRAYQWLQRGAAQHKVVVLFTDGAPDNKEQTAAKCVELRRRGIRLLVGSIALGLDRCARSMPGSVVFSVDPSKAASSLQVALKRIRK